MARNLPAGNARPQGALFQDNDNRGAPQQARRGNNNFFAGWSWANVALYMAIFGIFVLPMVMCTIAPYCHRTTTPVSALVGTCSWLVLLSPLQWATVERVSWVAAIVLLAVLEGISVWRDGGTPLATVGAVTYLLLKESFWYGVRFR